MPDVSVVPSLCDSSDDAGRFDEETSCDDLIAALDDDRWRVRVRAAQHLAERADDPAVLLRLGGCLRHVDYRVRRSAAEALTRVGPPAIETLVGALAEREAVRRNALQALTAIGAPAVFPLCARLRSASVPQRRVAADALGRLGRLDAAGALRAALLDIDPEVRWRAAVALGEIGARAEGEALAACLTDDHPEVRWRAASALGALAHAPAVPALIARLEDPVAAVRAASAWALGQIRDTDAIRPLLARLGETDHKVRCSALRALGAIGGPGMSDTLARVLETERSGDARVVILESLGKVGDRPAVETLIACLASHDPQEARAAAGALRSLGSVAAPLLAACMDILPQRALAAARSLLEHLPETG